MSAAGAGELAETGRDRTAIAELPRAYAVEVVLDTDLANARRSVFVEMGVPEATPRSVRLVAQADDLDSRHRCGGC